MQNSNPERKVSIRRASTAGFSLLELLVTLAVFLVISAAAFNLAVRHLPVFASQQSQSTLNFGLRNAAAQLQIDSANAGSGYYTSLDITSWPIGLTIAPGSAGLIDCRDAATHTYKQECFDAINVIRVDPNAPPMAIGKDLSDPKEKDDNCQKQGWLSNSSTLFVQPYGSATLDQVVNTVHKDDRLLVISKKSQGDMIAVIRLTQDAKKTGVGINLNHNKTGADGENTVDDDPYLISTTVNNKLDVRDEDTKTQTGFCIGDLVLKLAPVVYTVDANDKTNPKLVRLHPDDPKCLPTAVPPYNQECVIAEQVIGFRVGAQIVDPPPSDTVNSDCNPYCYVPSHYGKDWSRIRGVRVTIIGRTPPNPTAKFRNAFDKGPYRVEAVSVLVSPRALTMRDEK